jgi:nucleotide-binding universal stress UspA family protein
MDFLHALQEFQAWLDSSPPAFLFLWAVPLLIVMVALGLNAMRACRKARTPVQPLAVDVSVTNPDTATPTRPSSAMGIAMAKVLIPVDGSENALRAVRHVVSHSLSQGRVEAHLLHVHAPFSRHISRFTNKRSREAHYREQAEQSLANARELLHRHGIPHASHLDIGDPAECIHRLAQRLHVSRIVMGTSRKNALTRVVQGSVTSRVLQIAEVPVEVVAGGKISRLERFGVPAGIGTALAALAVAITD